MIGVQQARDYLRGSGLKSNPVQVGVTDGGACKGTDEFGKGVTLDQPDPNNGAAPTPMTSSSHGTRPAASGARPTRASGRAAGSTFPIP